MKLKAPRFTADQFVDTPYKGLSAADKAAFANSFGRFVVDGMPETRWKSTKALYRHLMYCFNHIAHFDSYGFYAEWFTTAHDRARFIKNILQAPCYGSPENGRSDVEKAIQQWVRESGLREHFAELKLEEYKQEAKAKLMQIASTVTLNDREKAQLIKELNKK